MYLSASVAYSYGVGGPLSGVPYHIRPWMVGEYLREEKMVSFAADFRTSV